MISSRLLQETVNDIIYKTDHIARGTFSDIILLYGKKDKYILRQPTRSTQQQYTPSEIYSQYQNSHDMYNNSYPINQVKSYGVVPGDMTSYHVQDYVDGFTVELREYTPVQVNNIAQHIGKLHSILYTGTSAQSYYTQSLQYLLSGSQGLLSYQKKNDLFADVRYSTLLELYKSYQTTLVKKRSKRSCVCLHGDLSEKNIIFTTHGVRCIDFNHIPYGEAGIDVSIFRARLIISDLLEKKDILLSTGRYFLDSYLSYTQDYAIINYLPLGLLYVGALQMGNPHSHMIAPSQKETLYNFIREYLNSL